MKEESVFYLKTKELIIRNISSLISREVKIENDFITIPDINLSKDLKNATVYFRLIQNKNIESASKKLNSMSNEISVSLFKKLNLRNYLKIKFQNITLEEGLDLN